MPNTKSANKRLRQNVVLRQKNKSAKSAVKTQMKKVIAAAEAGDIATAETEYVQAAKRLDQAGAKRIIHKNAVARQKSRLQRLIKKSKSKD